MELSPFLCRLFFTIGNPFHEETALEPLKTDLLVLYSGLIPSVNTFERTIAACRRANSLEGGFRCHNTVLSAKTGFAKLRFSTPL